MRYLQKAGAARTPSPEGNAVPAAAEFKVGDHAEAAAAVTLRQGESLNSPIIDELPARTSLVVLEVGQGRRMKVSAHAYQVGMEGWVSNRTKENEQLVVKTQAAGRAAAAAATGGAADLERAAEAVRGAVRRHGAGAPEAQEAFAVLSSEVEKVQQQAQAAAEMDDMDGFQRMADLVSKYVEVAEGLQSEATTPATSRSASPAPPLAAVRLEDLPGEGEPGERKKKKKKKHKHHKDADFDGDDMPPADAEGWGMHAPPAPQSAGGWEDGGFGGPVSPDAAAAGWSAGEGDFGGQGGFGGSGPAEGDPYALGRDPPGFAAEPAASLPAAFAEPAAAFPGRPPSQAAADAEGLWVVPAAAAAPPQPTPWEGASWDAAAAQAPGPGSGPAWDGGPTGEEAARPPAPPRAWRPAAPAGDPLEPDGCRNCRALREANRELQRELDDYRQQLQAAQDRASVAAARLAEREQMVSETRQRLFDAKAQIARLEEEASNQAEVHATLQGRVESARAQQLAAQEEVRVIREAMETGAGLASGRGSVPHGSHRHSAPQLPSARPPGAPAPSVNQSDELAAAKLSAGAPAERLAGRGGAGAGGGAGGVAPGPGIPATPAEVWQQTSRIGRRMGALVSRAPPARRECIDRTNDCFRALLSERRGPYYEDEQVAMHMSLTSSNSGSRPCLDFDVAVANRGVRPIHEVRLVPGEPVAFCELRVQQDPQAQPGGRVAPRQRATFHGQLAALGPFEAAPQVILSYFLPDDSECRVRLRLPLAISQLMSPSKVEAREAVDLWGSEDFVRGEVAAACAVRGTLLSSGAPFSVWRALELGGALASVPGATESPRGILLVSSYPQKGQRVPALILARVELGGPGGLRAGPPADAKACRVCVRSASHLVNRALTQALLDVLCEVADPVLMP